MKNLDLIKKLTQAHGVSGFERDVRNLMEQYLTGKGELSQDNLGSFYCRKVGNQESPRIMVNAHMDEIGFMVSGIKRGFIKFVPIGSWWDQVLLAQKIIIKTRKGDVKGVIGSKPPHMMTPPEVSRVCEKNYMFIDVGASSNEEAEAMGICIGDPIVPDSSFEILKDKIIMAKAVDCRLGCGVVVNLMEMLSTAEHPNTVYGVGTVQEEPGLRGAMVAANNVQPDICLTLEGGLTTDIPGTEGDDVSIRLGGGPIIDLYDKYMIANPSLLQFVLDTARENNIPVQCGTALGAGTDAGEIQKYGSGVPSITFAIPARYIHSHNGIFNYDDYEMTINLMYALVKKLDAETVQAIKRGEYSRN